MSSTAIVSVDYSTSTSRRRDGVFAANRNRFSPDEPSLISQSSHGFHTCSPSRWNETGDDGHS